VLAVARPRTGLTTVEMESEGITIVLVVDISSSMLALDMTPRDRLGAAKETVTEFIRARPQDRLGLVAFAGEAITQVPVTVDHEVVERAVHDLRVGLLEDGTAIGTAIVTATNRLRRAPGKSKVIVLLTDGENNRGEIDPLRIYTIGVGREGVAPVPVAQGPLGLEYANLPVRIDEELLRRVATLSGAQYFRATHTQALEQIYRRIDELERTPVKVRRSVEYREHGRVWLVLAGALLLGEWLLRARRFPLLA
jgi:Ca-activated chloride channel family protein